MNTESLPYERIIFVCCNQRDGARVCCNDSGGNKIREKLKEVVKEYGIQKKVRVSKSGCLGQCGTGVNIVISPDNIWLKNVTEDDIDEIIKLYIDTKK